MKRKDIKFICYGCNIRRVYPSNYKGEAPRCHLCGRKMEMIKDD